MRRMERKEGIERVDNKKESLNEKKLDDILTD